MYEKNNLLIKALLLVYVTYKGDPTGVSDL